MKIIFACKSGKRICGLSGLKGVPSLRARDNIDAWIEILQTLLKESPTRPATFGEFNSNPAGVSRIVIRKVEGIAGAMDSNTRPPARDVSPEPSKAMGPQAFSIDIYLSSNSRAVFQT